MQNALLVGLSRQSALRRQLDVIANNIANQNTNGYKADGLIYEEFAAPRPGNEKFMPPINRNLTPCVLNVLRIWSMSMSAFI